MRILLLAPPVASPFYPPLGLPSLAAFIRSRSRHSCVVADLSTEAINQVLGAESLSYCRSKLESRIRDLEARAALTGVEQKEYLDATSTLVRSRAVIDATANALSNFRTIGQFKDKRRRVRAIRSLNDALELVSAAYGPFTVTTGEMTCGSAPYSLKAVSECVRYRRSPLCDYLERRTVELVRVHRPDVIGVSVNYYGQLIAAFEVLRCIRKACPDATTVIGGGLMPEIATAVVDDPVLSPLIDYAICYEGETAIVRLLDELEIGKVDTRNVPNLVVRFVPDKVLPILDGSGSSAQSIAGGRSRVLTRHREDVHTLPLPDFSDLQLSTYLSPEPIIPLLTSRGCYWGACAFCTHFHTYGDDYRTGTGAEIVDAMEALAKRYQTSRFYFVDESLAPSKARAISEELLSRQASMTWGTELRFEQSLTSELIGLMAAAGCRVLSFGLESGSQAVLDAMDKGIRIEDVHRILEDLRRQQIHSHVMCIIGFPGETLSDVNATLSVIRKHKRSLALVGFSPFTLNVNSIVHRSPERFGVQLQRRLDPFRPDINFSVRSGISQLEAAALYDQVVSSPDIIEVDAASATATREHLLFLPYRHTDSEDALGAGDVEPLSKNEVLNTDFWTALPEQALFTFSFNLQRATQAEQWAKEARLWELYSGPEPAPLPLLEKSRAFYAYIESMDKLLQVSESVVDVIRWCDKGMNGTSLIQRICGARAGDDECVSEACNLVNRLCLIGVLNAGTGRHGEAWSLNTDNLATAS